MMTLRYKFGLLGLLYVATLAVNVAFCSWSLVLYYQAFLGRATAAPLPVTVEGTGSAPVLEDPDGDEADEGYILRILGANALCGIAIGGLGLRLVRDWVIRPVARLRDAALAIGRGDLAHRVRVDGQDELAQLAAAVNTMAASVAAMQEQAVEHQRRQAAAQTLRCIVHNVRSPLTGIRWLAEAVAMRRDIDRRTAEQQAAIVDRVDAILGWLQRFRDSLNAMEGNEHGKHPDRR
jgi:signal transduction histidine kinase